MCNFSLFTNPCDLSSLFLKEQGISRSDSKQAQGDWNEANTTLLQRR